MFGFNPSQLGRIVAEYYQSLTEAGLPPNIVDVLVHDLHIKLWNHVLGVKS